MHADDCSLTNWISHLRALAAPLPDAADVVRASDVAPAFLTAVDDRLEAGLQLERSSTAERPEIQLWRTVAHVNSRRPDEPAQRVALEFVQQQGTSLFPRDQYHAIEVWTEAELCGLHALWNLAIRTGRDDLQERCRDLIDWHLEHTQPDNATNRAWALHVFLLHQSPEATHYAETLLHNAIALEGRPAPLNAWILHDAANQLDGALHRE